MCCHVVTLQVTVQVLFFKQCYREHCANVLLKGIRVSIFIESRTHVKIQDKQNSSDRSRIYVSVMLCNTPTADLWADNVFINL